MFPQQKNLLPQWYLTVYLQRWWCQKARTKPIGVSDSGHGASGLQKSEILLLVPEGTARNFNGYLSYTCYSSMSMNCCLHPFIPQHHVQAADVKNWVLCMFPASHADTPNQAQSRQRTDIGMHFKIVDACLSRMQLLMYILLHHADNAHAGGWAHLTRQRKQPGLMIQLPVL